MKVPNDSFREVLKEIQKINEEKQIVLKAAEMIIIIMEDLRSISHDKGHLYIINLYMKSLRNVLNSEREV